MICKHCLSNGHILFNSSGSRMGTPPSSHSQLVFTCKALTETGIILWKNAFYLNSSSNLVFDKFPKTMFKIDLHPFLLQNFQLGHWTQSLPVALLHCLLGDFKDERHVKIMWYDLLWNIHKKKIYPFAPR